MLNPLRTLTILLVPVLILAAIACGGDDDDGGTDETAAATTTGQSDEETPEATEGEEEEEDAPEDGDAESYFTELEEILVVGDLEQESIGNRLNALTTDDPDYVTDVQEAFHDSAELFSGSIDDLSDLEPTEEAEDAHDDYVANLMEAHDLLSELSTEVDEATTAADIDSAVGEYEPLISAENAQNEDLCLDLQDIADENDVDVDLQCTT